MCSLANAAKPFNIYLLDIVFLFYQRWFLLKIFTKRLYFYNKKAGKHKLILDGEED